MIVSRHLQKIELNKNDPDYHIEDFWYNFKSSVYNFYSQVGIEDDTIEIVSLKLNQYKKKKEYSLIKKRINNYIYGYVIDVMKYENIDSYYASNILMTNIKRWNKICQKFNFDGTDEKEIFINEFNKIMLFFKSFLCIKLKKDKDLLPIVILFKNIDKIIAKDNYFQLFETSIKLYQSKMLDAILKSADPETFIMIVNNKYPNLITAINISGLKLNKRFVKYFSHV
jgi:hypothetical protein